jgi:hypothetical protein
MVLGCPEHSEYLECPGIHLLPECLVCLADLDDPVYPEYPDDPEYLECLEYLEIHLRLGCLECLGKCQMVLEYLEYSAYLGCLGIR